MSGDVLHLDFETYSEVDLGKAGVHVYAAHPSFAVTVIAWAFNDGPVQSVVWPATTKLPVAVEAQILAGGVIGAHNSAFERAVLNGYYKGSPMPPEQFDCTMQRALNWGLPGGLGDAGNALKLRLVKNADDRKLMLMMGKPRKPTKKEPNPLPWHMCDAAKLAALAAYCEQDVVAERALSKVLPPLTARERQISILDAKSNDMGVRIDRTGVSLLMMAAEQAQDALHDEAGKLINGGLPFKIGTQTPKLKAWLESKGLPLPDLKKETVSIALFNGVADPDVKRALQLRQLAAKSSLAKLKVMLATSGLDGRARGLLQYYGAGRTGRWAGRLIQVQNLPRPAPGTNPDGVHSILGSITGTVQLPGMFYPRPLSTISSCLRSCIVPDNFKMLLSLDLAQIEARVLAWLAGQADVLQAFRDKQDVYVIEAAKQGSSDRQFGKVLVLSCGFGAGWVKVQSMAAAQYGVTLNDQQAIDAVYQWRVNNSMIRQYWWDLLVAAMEVCGFPMQSRAPASQRLCRLPGGVISVGQIAMKKVGNCLVVKKPSGDKLYYHNPRPEPGKYGPEFTFDGLNQKNNQWTALRTYGGKFAENFTQSVARDVMADALLRIEKETTLLPVMTVHDEAVYEIIHDQRTAVDVARIKALFEEPPLWATDLPVASDAKATFRYGK